MLKEYIYGRDEIPVFDSDKGVGIKFESRGKKYTSVIPSRNKTKKALIHFLSWGKHVYAKIKVFDLDMHEEGTPKEYTTSVPDDDMPEEAKGFVIELRHILTQEEFDSCPQDWDGYDVGDYTSRFCSLKEARDLANEIFKKHFVGNWRLEKY